MTNCASRRNPAGRFNPRKSMTKKLPLRKGLFALVDDADFEIASAHEWTPVQATEHITYAFCSALHISLHRFLLGAKYVDHKNGDGLDNRRENLRACTHAENVRNRRKFRATTSRFKGVRKRYGCWAAEIEQNGQKLHLGNFQSEFAAARQYDRSARIFFGQFAKTNQDMGLFDGAEDRLLVKPVQVRRAKDKQFQDEMRRVGIEPRIASSA